MKINEVMKITGLTKKAIYYYEEVGLIKPAKDNDNDYRVYTEKDVDRLKQINALRKLDVSIKDINTVLDKPSEINEIMYKQLNLFNSRIEYLNKSKEIVESMINEFNKSNVGTIASNLERLTIYLDMDARASSGYMSKEIERIFPGGFGKLMSIMYGIFLDEPIDSDEKEKAWIGLVNALDSTAEIQFPDDIKNILEEAYENLNKEGLSNLKTKTESLINNVMTPTNELASEEKIMVDKKIEEYKNNINNKDMIEKTKKLFEFFKSTPQLLPKELGGNLKVLSSKYKMYIENFNDVMQSKYKFAKACDGVTQDL